MKNHKYCHRWYKAKDRKAVRLKRKAIRNQRKVNNDMEYIHYGSSRFDPLLVMDQSKTNMASINKPNAGLWASPVNSDWGWKDWCESEQFYKNDFSKYFVFKLKPNAKILTIRSLKDWNLVLNEILDASLQDSLFLDMNIDKRNAIWDYISKSYDAILVIMSDHYGSMHMSFEFNSWDCDSIVVFNPEVVNIVRHSA